jgi:hypothetical protein
VDRKNAFGGVRTGLWLGAAAILAFGMTFVFAVFYIA